MTFYPLVVQFTPDQVSKKTNITINQNVWNGNIYQDNSTNLTYIYPQYTTINNEGDTITNISNNPIIYNNETKQYYTYDTVTNNYYYITYEAPTPSPSPDPDPTPTPEPGGDTGDTSGIMKILQEIKAVLVSGFAGITGDGQARQQFRQQGAKLVGEAARQDRRRHRGRSAGRHQRGAEAHL